LIDSFILKVIGFFSSNFSHASVRSIAYYILQSVSWRIKLSTVSR